MLPYLSVVLGIANAVGLAAAEAHLAKIYNRPGFELIDHYTYVFMGDGCVMEGISYEACSLAGHWKLGKLIAIYDANNICIDGTIDLVFSENVVKRYESMGWHVLTVEDGNSDLEAIFKAIETAKQIHDKPSLICLKTILGYGSPNKSNDPQVHGAPLGAEEVKKTREFLSWAYKEFEVPEEVLEHFRRHSKYFFMLVSLRLGPYHVEFQLIPEKHSKSNGTSNSMIISVIFQN